MSPLICNYFPIHFSSYKGSNIIIFIHFFSINFPQWSRPLSAKPALAATAKKISANSIDTDPIPNQRKPLPISGGLDVAPATDSLWDHWLSDIDNLLIAATDCLTNYLVPGEQYDCERIVHLRS